jgi:thiol-disulfide isomerase/thioredoxin
MTRRAIVRGNPTRSELCSLLLSGLVLGIGCGRVDEPSAAGEVPAPAQGPEPLVNTPVLSKGDRLPPLTAAGWINGPAPSADGPGVKLLFVDLWSNWCPFCRSGAPELVRIQQKFADRGVAFVSLTCMDREAVASFVEQFGVRWSSGFGATPEVVLSLGVPAGSSIAKPGHEIAPTIYLVGPDGRIRWTDRQARFHHTEAGGWGRELEAAIEEALATPDPKN